MSPTIASILATPQFWHDDLLRSRQWHQYTPSSLSNARDGSSIPPAINTPQHCPFNQHTHVLLRFSFDISSRVDQSGTYLCHLFNDVHSRLHLSFNHRYGICGWCQSLRRVQHKDVWDQWHCDGNICYSPVSPNIHQIDSMPGLHIHAGDRAGPWEEACRQQHGPSLYAVLWDMSSALSVKDVKGNLLRSWARIALTMNLLWTLFREMFISWDNDMLMYRCLDLKSCSITRICGNTVSSVVISS
jgi:hypothetical protein